MPSAGTVGAGLAISPDRVVTRTVTSPAPTPARPAPPPPPSETPVESFFTALDFTALDGLSYRNGPLAIRVLSAVPVEQGEVINGFRCNDEVEIRLKITDSTGKSLIDLYRKIRRELHRAVSDAFQSGYVELVHLDFTEGSLWGYFKVKVKQVGAWMRKTGAATVQWARDHKDSIDFWLRTINNLVSILTNVMKILGWWFGGGADPGIA